MVEAIVMYSARHAAEHDPEQLVGVVAARERRQRCAGGERDHSDQRRDRRRDAAAEHQRIDPDERQRTAQAACAWCCARS